MAAECTLQTPSHCSQSHQNNIVCTKHINVKEGILARGMADKTISKDLALENEGVRSF